MKTLDELYQELDKLEKEERYIWKLVKKHPDYTKSYFSKLNVTEENKYLIEIIQKTTNVNGGWADHTYTFNGFHCKSSYQVVEGTFGGMSFYYDGEMIDEGDCYYVPYGKYISDRLTRILKIYLSSKCDSNVLERLLINEKVEEFVKVGFMLFLNDFIKR